MNLAMTINPWQDEQVIFAQQFSATHILAQAVLPSGSQGEWNHQILSAMRNRIEKAGLAFAGLDSLPIPYNRSVLGLSGGEKEIPAVLAFLQSAADAGIPLVCYRWITSAAVPTRHTPIGRGGAMVRSAAASSSQQANSSRDRVSQFLEAILPAAQKAGITLAFSPTSPLTHADILEEGFPGGLSDLMWLASQFTAPCHGIDLNLGVVFDLDEAEFDPNRYEETLLEFLERGKVLLVSAANRLSGDRQKREAFLNEGIINLPKIFHTLHQRGYRGIIRADRQPMMNGDTIWGHKSQAYAVGFLRAVLQAIG